VKAANRLTTDAKEWKLKERCGLGTRCSFSRQRCGLIWYIHIQLTR